MTAEHDGTGSTPEGDDPFAYLYRQQGGDGSTAPPHPQSASPLRSFNQVHTVGERQYGGQFGGGRTQQTQQADPAGYGQSPSAHYAAPETMPGGRAAARQTQSQHHGDGYGNGNGHGGGRSRNGLLVGAIAVVAAVVIGIGAAIYFNSDSKGEGGQSAASSGATAGGDGGGGGQNKPGDSGKLRKGKGVGKEDAAGLSLAGGAATATDVPNAQGKGGTYVGAMNTAGASATWTVNDVPKAGEYTFFVRYGVPGEDADSTLSVNGQPQSQPLNMSNFGNAQKGDWAKGWTRTFAWVNLERGENDITISCGQGNNCNFNLDQVSLKAGKVKR